VTGVCAVGLAPYLDVLIVGTFSLISRTDVSDVSNLPQDTSLDAHSAEAAQTCLSSVQSGAREDGGEAGEEPQRKMLELSEHQLIGQMPRKHCGKHAHESINVFNLCEGQVEEEALSRCCFHMLLFWRGVAV